MTRHINIDDDTSVGYSFLKNMYFVQNKNSYAYRSTIPEILDVLTAIAPNHHIVEQHLVTLYEQPEDLTEMSYTWEDKGDYIKTVQFNDYIDYPILFNRPKLYLANTGIFFDLSLGESTDYLADNLQGILLSKLGLSVTKSMLISILDMFKDEYMAAHPYNVISGREQYEGEEDVLCYGNTITLYNDSTEIADYDIIKEDRESQILTVKITRSNNVSKIPLDTLRVDDNDSAISYLQVSGIKEPTMLQLSSINKNVPLSRQIGDMTCDCLGLYSEIYSV